MKKLLISLLALTIIVASSAQAQIPGFTAAEVQTLGDLNFVARAQMNHTGPIKDRLYALAMAMKNQNGSTVISWKLADADPGYILGFMADTNFGGVDGHDPYNRSLVDRLAGYLAVPVKAVTWPSTTVPAPAPAPAPAPPAPITTGSIDSLVRAIVRQEIAKISGSSGGYSDLVSVGNGELTYLGRDNGGSRQGGIRGDFQVKFGINNYDGGARVLQNWDCFNPALPMATYGNDSRGAFSYNGAPCPRGTWSADQTYGQAFVIDGGWSQAGYDYSSGAQYKPSVLLASQRGGMDILFAVTPWRRAPRDGLPGDPVLNKTVMRLRSDGSADPVDIVIGGVLRTLKACGNTVCF